ncbi:FAD-dependent oxidoreductase, partial [Escherichia coli]|uniref:FAD-dependent oxidoreductase n=1 Tax=Escherichia coli TaxID=562 RepID=UPI003C747AAF
MSYGITMMRNVKNDFDAVIAGGGMIGAAVAIGLAQEGLRVAMVERQSPAPF